MSRTPRTDAWKAKLRLALAERGSKTALARFLADGEESKVKTRAVQIAKVVNQGRMPEAEFVLSVEAWLAIPARKRRKMPGE